MQNREQWSQLSCIFMIHPDPLRNASSRFLSLLQSACYGLLGPRHRRLLEAAGIRNSQHRSPESSTSTVTRISATFHRFLDDGWSPW